MFSTDFKGVLVLLGLGFVLYLWKGKEVKEAVIKAVDPVNPENIFNRTFEHIYKGVTGSKDNLGEDIADFFYGGDFNPYDIERDKFQNPNDAVYEYGDGSRDLFIH